MVFFQFSLQKLGEYRGDFWTFSFLSNQFTCLKVKYENPENSQYIRSNHTACYHSKTNSIYLFGGSVQRDRYNDLNIFHVPTCTLRQQDIFQEIMPRARTYHAAEIIENDMYIIGGESENGDLQDISVYDISKNVWNFPKVTGSLPRRRFLTCTRIEKKLFLFGGCIQDYHHFKYFYRIITVKIVIYI